MHPAKETLASQGRTDTIGASQKQRGANLVFEVSNATADSRFLHVKR